MRGAFGIDCKSALVATLPLRRYVRFPNQKGRFHGYIHSSGSWRGRGYIECEECLGRWETKWAFLHRAQMNTPRGRDGGSIDYGDGTWTGAGVTFTVEVNRTQHPQARDLRWP